MKISMSPESRPSVCELDVRPIIAAHGSPLGAILAAVEELPPDGALRLIAPFEPVPLYARLGDLGFTHVTRPLPDGSWEILFSRSSGTPPPVLLNLRALEPPEPMQRALEAATMLASGGTLIALTRFRPVHLLSLLDERGFAWETNEQPDGSWETIVTREPAS